MPEYIEIYRASSLNKSSESNQIGESVEVHNTERRFIIVCK